MTFRVEFPGVDVSTPTGLPETSQIRADASQLDTFEMSYDKMSEFLGSLPSGLLAHELTHLMQSTATIAGIRQFAATNRYQADCETLVRALAERMAAESR